MKKLKVWLAALVTLVIGVCCLVACGDGKVEGTYKLSSVNAMGTEVSVSDYPGVSEDSFVVELKEDGTVAMTAATTGSSNTIDGTWTKDEDGNVTISVPGFPYTVEYKSGDVVITMGAGGMSVVYILEK